MPASRRRHVAAKAKSIAKNLARGTKGTVISAVTGAAAYKLGQMAYQQSDTVKNQPYALPIVYVVGGHLLKKKSIDAGAGLIAVGAFLGFQAYEAEAAKKKLSGSLTTPGGTVSGTANPTGKTAGAMGDWTSGGGAGDVGWARRMDAGARAYPGAGALIGGEPIRMDSTPRATTGAVRGGAMRSAMGLSDT